MRFLYRQIHLLSLFPLQLVSLICLAAILASGCSPENAPVQAAQPSSMQAPPPAAPPANSQSSDPSASSSFPERPRYAPGELVDYTAQSGDTLPGLALRFNTNVDDILAANTFIPKDATTMPPGMPMKIPIYYMPLWGTPYQIIPDSLFINGPAQSDFDTTQFINSHPGWLKNVSGWVSEANRTAPEIVDLVALNYSVSPRLLLALLEYQSGALTQPGPTNGDADYPLGFQGWEMKGLYLQLAHASNLLNDGYYRFRENRLTEINRQDGRLERIDPWQNAATVALHNYFNLLYRGDRYDRAISPEGFAATYLALFGDPWQTPPHIPGSLTQPAFILPFEPGDVWAMTGGPHTGWGIGEPLAAIDFAPPSKSAGCVRSDRWETAVADGLVVRSDPAEVLLDLDGDGDERTGWVIFYLHVATEGRVRQGVHLKQGDRIGHPSCEGGEATGTHLHMARKYNGEWVPADGWGGAGILAFNLEGWTVHAGDLTYQGTMTRFSQVVTSCTCSNAASWVKSDRLPLRTPTPEPPAGDYDQAIANIRFITGQSDLRLSFREITNSPNANLRKVIIFGDNRGNTYTVDFDTYQVIEFVQDHNPPASGAQAKGVDELRAIAHDFAARNSFAFAQNAGQLTFSEMTKDGTTYAFRWETSTGANLAMRPFLQIVIGVDGRIIGYIDTLDVSMP